MVFSFILHVQMPFIKYLHMVHITFSMGEELDDGFIIEDFIIKYNTYVYYIYIYLIVEEFRHLRGGLC